MSEKVRALSTDTHTLPDGRTLAYTSSGDADGFPVVAHHGTPGSRLLAALLSESASIKGIKLIVPDRPGYGRSSPPPQGWTWWDWQEDLTELLHSKSIERAAVMGFSGGGPFALAAGTSDWATRVGLVSSVIPPADTFLPKLSKIPFALSMLFRLSNVFARVSGPEAVVKQYTNRAVPESVSQAVAADFHEALEQGPKAVERENKSFVTTAIDSKRLSTPVQAWHGLRDENTPISPVKRFLSDTDGVLVASETDHLGTLLDSRKEVFEWLGQG